MSSGKSLPWRGKLKKMHFVRMRVTLESGEFPLVRAALGQAVRGGLND
jgi:hypothetical protein